MSICSCGHETRTGDRYCSQCGLVSGGQVSGGQVSGGLDSDSLDSDDTGTLLMSPVSNDQVETSSEVQTGFPTRLAVIGGLVIAALTWALFAWPQDETALGPDDAQSQEDSSPDESTEEDTAEEDRTEDSDADTSPDTTERAEIAGDEDDVAGTQTQQTSNVDEPADEVDGESVEVEPLIGELTGLGLVLGGYDSSEVRIISLDTGEEQSLTGVRGVPVGRIGSVLVVASWDRVSVVDLAVADPEPTMIYRNTGGGVESTFIDSDLIWTAAVSEGRSVRLVGLASDGREVDSVEIDSPGYFFGSIPTPDLATSPGGGVYRRAGDDFERFSTGSLRAVGQSIMLIDECDDRRRCSAVWYSRSDLETLDFPAPPPAVFGYTSVAGGDRWLATTDFQNGGVSIVEIASGEVTRTIEDTNFFGPAGIPSISDDGRWLFEPSRIGDSVIVGLDSGTEWPIEIRVGSDNVGRLIDLSGTVLGSG